MKISVITVCYNSQATLQKAIDSVASQRGVAIEHIVIDGGSRDATLDIIRHNAARLAYWVSEPDNGVYQAMNKGLQRATGDVIAFLNSDDVYSDEEVLARVAQRMDAQGLDALYGDVAFFKPEAPDTVVRVYDSSRFRPSRIGWGWMPAHPALFVRRAIYQRFGHFREEYRIAGDYEFVARIFKDGQLKSQHVAQVLVRMQSGGLSTAGLRATFVLNREILQACRDNGIRSNWAMVLSKYFFKLRELVHA